jgi:hypothetical protein
MTQELEDLYDSLCSFNKEVELTKVFSPIHNLEKIKINHGAKEPFESGTNTNTYYKDINMKQYNTDTPHGGYHYYFKYKSEDNNDNYLKNGTQFKGTCLNFKTEGG